jgi:poly-gamma-glutamate capsule biosynthesis protein CapA/YwtB (metallophosphatase superfamily)
LLLVGDVMLGDRAAMRIAAHGADYPFAALLPLFRHARCVVTNLEAPFTTAGRLPTRRYSYQVDPAMVVTLTRAGIAAVNLANNHIMDCGPDGLRQTMDTLARSGVGFFGAGATLDQADDPLILQTGNGRVGFLGFYWNPRCSATANAPGCAPSDPHLIEATVRSVRPHVDYLVTSFHWGHTYNRQPSEKAQQKARLAIESGADIVIGHHPHLLQPLEWYRGKPIFYSLGNCLMGSGNGKAEGLAVGVRRSGESWLAEAHALYVKNRDARVNYQPKVLQGTAALRAAAWLYQIDNRAGVLRMPLA